MGHDSPRETMETELPPSEENSDFNYSDLEPDETLRHEVKGLIRRLYDYAPDGSVIRGTLKKVGPTYKGVLKIIHGGGQMLVVGVQRSTIGTLQVLEERIWGKIKRWRKIRYRNLKTSSEAG